MVSAGNGRMPTSHGDVATFEADVGDWPWPSQMTIVYRAVLMVGWLTTR